MATPIRMTHELDAAWIIALWKAIYGGDPIPAQPVEIDARTAELANELAAHLARTSGAKKELTFPEFQKRFAAITGIKVTEGPEAGGQFRSEEIGVPTGSRDLPPYCFQFGGATICVPRRQRVQAGPAT